jgi:alkaline phosphatase
MEAPEVPLEQTQEHINEHAHGSRVSWVLGVALTSALLAAFAAVSSLMAGHHANEAMMEQMQSSDQWAFYQAKGIKAGVLTAKADILRALGKEISKADEKKMEQYKDDQEKIQEEAKQKQEESEAHLHTHVILARSVTMFQVGIAISAISVLTKRRRFWYVGIAFGVIGVGFFIQGLLTH